MQSNRPPSNQLPINANQQDGEQPVATTAPALPVVAVTNTLAQPAMRPSVITTAAQQRIQQQAAAQQRLYEQQQAARQEQLGWLREQQAPAPQAQHPDVVAQAGQQAIFRPWQTTPQVPMPPPQPQAESALSLLANAAIAQQAQTRAEARLMTARLRAARYAPYAQQPPPQQPQQPLPPPQAGIASLLARQTPVAPPALAALPQLHRLDDTSSFQLAQLRLRFLPQPVAAIPPQGAFLTINYQRISIMQLAPITNLTVAQSSWRSAHTWLGQQQLNELITIANQEQYHVMRFKLLMVIACFAGCSTLALQQHSGLVAATINRWVHRFLQTYHSTVQSRPNANALQAAIEALRQQDSSRLQQSIVTTLTPAVIARQQQLTPAQLYDLTMLCDEHGLVLTNPHSLRQILTTGSRESMSIGPHRIPIEQLTLPSDLKLGFSDMRVGGSWHIKPFHPNFRETQLAQLITKANEARGILRMRLIALVMLATGKTIQNVNILMPSLSHSVLRTLRHRFETALNALENLNDITAATEAMTRIHSRAQRQQEEPAAAAAAGRDDANAEQRDNSDDE